MTTAATPYEYSNTTEATLLVAFELSEKTWKLGFTTGHGQRHLRAFLDKLSNVEREVLDRLIALNVALPSGGRPDAVVVFL